MAPIAAENNRSRGERLHELMRAGFARVRIDGELLELTSEIDLEKFPPEQIDLVVDRLMVRAGMEKRLADSIEVAARFGAQVIKVAVQPADGAQPASELVFSQKFVCIECGTLLAEITPKLFSFNSPVGACPALRRPRRARIRRSNKAPPVRNAAAAGSEKKA
jgi:excinuclease ABC subunit A